MAHEVWRDVVGYEGSYQVSNLGRVRSLDRKVTYHDGRKKFVKGITLAQEVHKDGFKKVRIQHKTLLDVDKIVADAFVSRGKAGQFVFHINGDFSDCDPSNLKWLDEEQYFEECYRVRYNPEPDEEWRNVNGYDGLYDVSSYGNVRSHGRVVRRRDGSSFRAHATKLKPIVRASDGGLNVSLTDCKRRRHTIVSVERLVVDTFTQPAACMTRISHINGNVLDNRACNLKRVRIASDSKNDDRAKAAEVKLENFDKSTGEEWRDVDGYEGLYQVSNFGRVRSIPRTFVNSRGSTVSKPSRILAQKLNPNGYCAVWMYKDRKKHYNVVHRMVAKAFIHNPNGYPNVDHINADRTDARASNLRWCTQKQNMRYAIESGRMPYGKILKKLKSPENEKRRLRAISKAVVRDDGKVYASQIEAARDLGYTSECAVRDVATGKRKSCRGHTFRYIS